MKLKDKLAKGLFGLLPRTPHAPVDSALLEALQDQLLLADVGVESSELIIQRLRQRCGDATQILPVLREIMLELLTPCAQPFSLPPTAAPFVVLMVGSNGSGKTTTLAKIAARFQRESVTQGKLLFAACDTFRAAAIEQLQDWGARLDIPVIAQTHGADPAAVAYDAYRAARARGASLLLVDTAGRQHTHDDLMAQLQKLKRVLNKAHADAERETPTGSAELAHEVWLSVDANTGYNALSQAEHYQQRVGLDGFCVTKLDGSAKGGVVVALAQRFGVPIRYVGVGQGATDLREFSASEFVDALLPQEMEA